MIGFIKRMINHGITVIVFCVVVMSGLTPASAAILVSDLSSPADSPIWWTLTDEIAPEQLRAILRDRDAHVERYRTAVEKGYAAPASEAALARLIWYRNGALWPELMSVFDALDALVTNAYMGDEETRWPADRVERGLMSAGMPREEARVVLATLSQVAVKEQFLIKSYSADQTRFVTLLEKVYRRTGRDLLEYAQMDESAVSEISRITGTPEYRVRELRRMALRSPTKEALVPGMLNLRQELSVAGWRGLRTYLRTRVVPGTSDVDFAADEGDVEILYGRYRK